MEYNLFNVFWMDFNFFFSHVYFFNDPKQLDNNWKIYWKNPGEAGLPPKIIFDKISNVSNVNLLFPEPKSFKFFNIDTFGYDKEIIFPLKIYVKNPDKIIFGE